MHGIGQSSQLTFAPTKQSYFGTGVLQSPFSSVIDGAGDLYVVDQMLNSLFKITPDGTTTQVPLPGVGPLNSPLG